VKKPTFRAKNGRENLTDTVLGMLVPAPDPKATLELATKLKFSAEKQRQIVVPN
jgi:hypothetical protein